MATCEITFDADTIARFNLAATPDFKFYALLPVPNEEVIIIDHGHLMFVLAGQRKFIPTTRMIHACVQGIHYDLVFDCGILVQAKRIEA